MCCAASASLTHSIHHQASEVETAIKEATETCADGVAAECAAAWDVVEEVSAAASDNKTKAKARACGFHSPRAAAGGRSCGDALLSGVSGGGASTLNRPLFAPSTPQSEKKDPLEEYCESDPSADEWCDQRLRLWRSVPLLTPTPFKRPLLSPRSRVYSD